MRSPHETTPPWASPGYSIPAPRSWRYSLSREAEALEEWTLRARPRFCPTHFYTLTFSSPVLFDLAEQKNRWWLRQVARKFVLGAVAGRQELLPFLASIEPHASGQPHIHGLVEADPLMDERAAGEIWKRRFGVQVRVARFDPERDGLGYVLKQVGASGSFDVASELKERVARPMPRV